MEEVKVKKFICKCGNARMLTVMQPDSIISKKRLKEQTELLKAGLDVVTISLEEARKTKLCFACKL